MVLFSAMWSRLKKEKVNEHGQMVARPESLVKDNYDVTTEPQRTGIAAGRP
jgi:hypothetical protein